MTDVPAVNLFSPESGRTYRISAQPLGSGGFGHIYVAVNDQGEKVAVKVYDHEHIRDRQVVQEAYIHRYLAEQGVSHIARFVEGPIVTEEGSFVVMELVRGRSLHHLIEATRRHTWTAHLALARSREFLGLMHQITLTLARIHAACVVHYDLKPNNIQIRADSLEPVILDFGLACFRAHCQPAQANELFRAAATSRLYQCRPHKSVHGYTPPEITEAEDPVFERSSFRAYDFQQMDLYALGKVFADLALGVMAYERDLQFERRLHNLPTHKAARLYDTRNPALNGIVQDLLFATPGERPSADRVAARLAEVVLDQPFPIFSLHQKSETPEEAGESDAFYSAPAPPDATSEAHSVFVSAT